MRSMAATRPRALKTTANTAMRLATVGKFSWLRSDRWKTLRIVMFDKWLRASWNATQTINWRHEFCQKKSFAVVMMTSDTRFKLKNVSHEYALLKSIVESRGHQKSWSRAAVDGRRYELVFSSLWASVAEGKYDYNLVTESDVFSFRRLCVPLLGLSQCVV